MFSNTMAKRSEKNLRKLGAGVYVELTQRV